MKSLFLYLILFTSLLNAQNNTTQHFTNTEKNWGVGLVVRTATIPYIDSDYSKDSTVSSFIPFL